MATQDLSDLRARVRDWTTRQDISDSLLNDFINIAQTRLNRTMRVPPIESEATIAITNGNTVLIPQDFLEMISIFIPINGRNAPLERKDISFVETLASINTDPNPVYFSRRGNNFILASSPQEAASVTLYYYAALQPLVEDADTNWFVTDAPDAMLYGSLTEAFLYLQDDENALKWETKFQNVATSIQQMEDIAAWSGSSLGIIPTGG